MFYLAPGYFLSYLPCALQRAAVLALAPDVADRTHRLAGSDLPQPSATSLDEHRRTTVLFDQPVRMRSAEQFP